MKFQREKFHEVYGEMLPLLKRHWEEIAHFRDLPLGMDINRYAELEASGALRTFTVRKDEGQLIGYAVFIVSPNLHYRTSLQALQDVLFIVPEERGFGKNLIQWCDDQLKAEGVQFVHHHTKAKHNFGPMLERIGYELVDLIYSRRIN